MNPLWKIISFLFGGRSGEFGGTVAVQWAAPMGSDFIKYLVGTSNIMKIPASVVEAVTVKLGPLLGPNPVLKGGPKVGSLVWARLGLK